MKECRMMSESYRKRGMDLKRLYLCLQGKLWLFLLMIVTGAVIGGVGYQVAKATGMPITYEAESKLYISFGVDESGEIYQYYNGYTWNDLLDADPMLNAIMEYVPYGYTKAQVQEATKAEILSDIRLLTITVSGESEKAVREIQAAVEKGLVDYAKKSEELKRIEVIRTTEPVRVYWDDRTITAAIIGGVLFAIFTIIILFLFYVLDDALYVESDIERRYNIKPLGLLMLKQRGLQPYARELKANFEYILSGQKEFALIDMGNQCELRAAELELVLNAEDGEFVGGDGEAGGLTWTLPQKEKKSKLEALLEKYHENPETEERKDNHFQSKAYNGNVLTEQDLSEIREIGGVVVLVPFGDDVSRRCDRVLTLLKNQDCRVYGMIITKADEDFLERYYR